MRRHLFKLVFPAAMCSLAAGTATPLLAQTPTYAPSSPLAAPGEPLYAPDTSTVPNLGTPQSTIPQPTIPQSTIPQGTSPTPGTMYSVPGGNSFDPPATIVTPGSLPPATRRWGAWYPGYWLGVRPTDPPYGGGGPLPYQTNYQGSPMPSGGAGGCNTCPSPGIAPMMLPFGSQNLEFGRGYDGFMTGW